MKTLGEKIRALREERDMTGRELAKVLSVSPSTLSQYESNTRIPSDDVKIKICDYFNVSVDYLLGRADKPSSPEVNDDDDIRIEDLNFAFFDGMPNDLSEEEQKQIIAFARFMREERNKGK